MPQLPGESKAESMLLDRLEARTNARSLTLKAMTGRWTSGQRLRFIAEFSRGTDIVLEKLDQEKARQALQRKGSWRGKGEKDVR